VCEAETATKALWPGATATVLPPTSGKADGECTKICGENGIFALFRDKQKKLPQIKKKKGGSP